MNLLKRLFSIGSKKNKKQRPPIVHDVPLPEQPWAEIRPVVDEEHEAAVSRLLRSSSARYVESSELDYATLPPLPHPINKVIQTPASSTISLDSASVTQKGTYNVTVYGRRKHPSTDFGDTHRELEEKAAQQKNKRTSLHPVEDSRVLRLRSDPSVASLIDLYDDHGKLSADAFSNSPPKTPSNRREEGRAQVRRNGSTLRQLLGASSSVNSREGNDSGSGEGDISWAERFLAETEATSSRSSLVLQTPTASSNVQLPEPDISLVTDGSFANNTIDNPAISSMEVELSMSIDTSQDIELIEDEHKKSSPYSNSNPSTPQRASQIFGFLTRGKQSKPAEDLDRSLPAVPSCFSTPSEEHAPCENPDSHLQRDPPRFQFNPAHFPAMPLAHITDTPRNTRPQSLIEDSPSAREPRSVFSDDSHDHRFVPKNSFHAHNNVTPGPISIDNLEDNKNAIKVIMNGPTKVIVTAPTPSTNHNGPSRLLRGPRALPRKPSNGGLQRTRSALGELSNSSPTSPYDPFMAPPRKRAQTHRRRGSQSSTHSRDSCEAGPEYISRPKTLERTSSGGHRKENQLGLAVKTELPSTPLRSHTTGSRSLLRTVVQHSMFHPPVGMTPSPASSSEMSPVGRQIMIDVRQQRMKAREVDRQRHGSRYAAERDAQRL